MTPISFITAIKDRTKFTVSHDNKQIELNLFENNLRSLINIIQPTDLWEYIIVDFSSTDVNMTEFINSLPTKSNLHFKIFTLTEKFDRGMGLNYGAKLATHPVVFFYDADMMIRTRKLFDHIEKYVVLKHLRKMY